MSARRRQRRNLKDRETRRKKQELMERQAWQIQHLEEKLEEQEKLAADQLAEIVRLQHLEDPEYANAVARLTETVRKETQARLLVVAKLREERKAHFQEHQQRDSKGKEAELDLRYRAKTLKKAEREVRQLKEDLQEMFEDARRKELQLDREIAKAKRQYEAGQRVRKAAEERALEAEHNAKMKILAARVHAREDVAKVKASHSARLAALEEEAAASRERSARVAELMTGRRDDRGVGQEGGALTEGD